MDESIFNEGSPTLARLQFLLASFHAVVQERRTYLPQGWSKFYEFSYGDMKAGTYIVEAATAGAQPRDLDWEAIHGLMVDAVYGGRVTMLTICESLRPI